MTLKVQVKKIIQVKKASTAAAEVKRSKKSEDNYGQKNQDHVTHK